MGFDREYLPYSKTRYFTFYATGGSAANTASTMIEAFAPSFAFELDFIHLRLSSVHPSVVDFMVYLSNHRGSYYNYDLVSQAMNGIRDVFYKPASYTIFHSGDCIHCSMIYSAANHYGLEISGWAISQPVSGW